MFICVRIDSIFILLEHFQFDLEKRCKLKTVAQHSAMMERKIERKKKKTPICKQNKEYF